MSSHFATIEEVERLLARRFGECIAASADASPQAIEGKFITYDTFPTLGWGLIEAGTSQAEASSDPIFLYEMLTKFVSLKYKKSSQFDESGLNISSGYDYSELVDVAIYAAALGRMEFVAKLFNIERPVSKAGYPPVKHAANLLVALLNPSWKHIDKVISQAERFVASKSNAKVDKAFVRYFLGVAGQDSAQCSSAIAEFAELYCKSDWGRYKPFTKPVFLYGLLSLANRIHPGILRAGFNSDVLGESWSRLWTKYDERVHDYMRMECGFRGSLAFLNVTQLPMSANPALQGTLRDKAAPRP